MPIDPFSEQLFTMSEAAKRLPRLQKGRFIHTSTLWRWAKRGLRGIKLETTKLGGTRVTSAEALRRFFAALSQPETPPPLKVNARPEAAVDQALDEIGI